MNENKRGLLLINLGSPDSYLVSDVRKYLNEFLMDERVIDIPYLIRTMVVKGFIVPFRAPKSAHAYETIWTAKGSPLKTITQEFAALVQSKMTIPVAVAMRYGNPTPAKALQELEIKTGGLQEVLIAPMYPHYAMSSYETALEHVITEVKSLRKHVKVRVLKPFYSEPAYINSLAASIAPYLAKEEYDGYLFSYHGLPVRHLKKSDSTGKHCYSSNDCCEIRSPAWRTCYKHQVRITTKLVAEKLNLDMNKVTISYQSRLGNGWIEPFTDKVLEELPKKGVKKLLTLCPAFVADCLETLEEMDDRGKEIFKGNGGETFVRVPCMNTSNEWVDTFTAYCNGYEKEYKTLWN
jgi:ferrochelatase